MASQRFIKPINDSTCVACLALLPDYARLQLTNQLADIAYPTVAWHIETCSDCQVAYFREFRIQGLAKPLPELQQVSRRARAAHALTQILTPPVESWWQRVNEQLQRLTVEIPLLVKEAAATFGTLPETLAPQLTVVESFRSRSRMAENLPAAIELLTLPDHMADLLIKVSTGTVANHRCTLVVQLETLAAHEPIIQARTILRDRDGSLLEQRATDGDGLVLFGDLELTKYRIQIKHAGQTWEFSVVLTESR